MKIRWTENSLRFRITPTELNALQQGEAVQSSLSLPGSAWKAVVFPEAEANATRLIPADCEIRLHLAAADLAHLTEPDIEGVYFHSDTEPGRFRYFIEKDFPCIHPRAGDGQEPVTEAFAPPEGFTERKGVEAPAA